MSVPWLIIWGVYLFREFLKIIVLNIKYDGESQPALKIELFLALPKVIALTRSVKLKLPLKKIENLNFILGIKKAKFISKFQKKGNI